MKAITLGSTGISVLQNGFGALPIQRISPAESETLLQKAFEGGMTFFDTARAYSDSEEKMGRAFGRWSSPEREEIFIATKTQAVTPEQFWKDLDTSLSLLQTDYVDIYQFHNVTQVFAPDDGTGMYECMLDAKKQGVIRHIGITTHQIDCAEESVKSGLYETLQFPFSYLAIDREIQLVHDSVKADMGFIAMKGLSGGLLTNAPACMAFMAQFDNLVPIWGIQRLEELEEWLSFMCDTPSMTDGMREFVQDEQAKLQGNFCRSCGYCMPCPAGIQIYQCARMAQLLRRMPSHVWLSERWQAEMERIESCIDCGQCALRCPYGLNTPELLRMNLEDYRQVLDGKVCVTS